MIIGVWTRRLIIIIALLLSLGDSYAQTKRVYIKMLQDDQLKKSIDHNNISLSELTGCVGIKKTKPLSLPSSKNGSSNQRTIQKHSRLDNVFVLEVEESVDLDSLCRILGNYDNISSVEPEPDIELLYIPSDPSFSIQKHLDIIEADRAWDITQGSSDIVIGVSDTGVDIDHQDLLGNRYVNTADPVNGIDDDGNGFVDDFSGVDIADNDNNADDADGHGTKVAGVFGATTDNGLGVAGVGFNSSFFPIKVFRSKDRSGYGTYESILYAADLGLDVLNLSWGGSGRPSEILQDLIDYAVIEKDLVIVASAGNTDADLDFYPASYRNVLSVAMTEDDDQRVWWSTYSHKVDLCAPGINIQTTTKGGGYGTASGTSLASPIVAGVAALVRAEFPDYNALQVMEQVRISSDEIYDVGTNMAYYGKLGKGRLNAYKAVSQKNNAAVRIAGYDATSLGTTNLFAGDTIDLSIDLVNILRPVEGLKVKAKVETLMAELLDDEFLVGNIATLDTVKDYSLKLVVSDLADYNTRIPIRLEFEDNRGYSDFEYIDIYTNSPWADLSNGQFSVTINSASAIGYQISTSFAMSSFSMTIGDDIKVPYSGIIIGNHADSISDNVINDYPNFTRSNDFEEVTKINEYYRSDTDQYIRNLFADSRASNDQGLLIEQEYLLIDDEDYLISEYYVTNTKNWDRDNLKMGLFADVNVGLDNIYNDKVDWDVSSGILYSYDELSSQYVGISLLSSQVNYPHAINVRSGSSVFEDIIGGKFSKTSKYNALNSSNTSAGGVSGSDVAQLLIADLGTLSSKGSAKVAFTWLTGNSLSDLIVAKGSAQMKYSQFLATPNLDWNVEICEDVPVQFENTETVKLYKDALGLEPIVGAEGIKLSVPGFAKDSTFYYQSVTDGYYSDFKRVDVDIMNMVADFKAEPAVLYLGEIEHNRVNFTDNSIGEASEWEWDFNNGYLSSSQNPSSFFNTLGEYDIDLQIKNDKGCDAQVTIKYLVDERSPAPIIDDEVVCKGGVVTLDASNSNVLKFYLTEELSELPFFQGTEWTTPALNEPTTYYVSSHIDTKESKRIAVDIDINPVEAIFEDVPFRESDGRYSMQLINKSVEAVSVSWKVNNIDQGSSSLLKLDPAGISQVDVELTATSLEGCIDVSQRNIPILKSVAPTSKSIEVCKWSDSLIESDNGEKYVYYADEARSQFLGYGTELMVKSIGRDTVIYMAAVDNYVESDLVEINFSISSNETEILATPEVLYWTEGNTATFEYDGNESKESFQWFVDGELLDQSSSPTISFGEIDMYKVTLVTESATGCIDTVSLDYQIELAADIANPMSNIGAYPNPFRDKLFITESVSSDRQVFVHDIMGRQVPVYISIEDGLMILSFDDKQSGLFFVRVSSSESSKIFQVFRER
ncbi:S8 family serine peptidase [Reichenbachiella versicolor]|uniref:S8 family serine peptidase n=1 Tax=Reichenbachiella versicolor TaxID=1821036 RepID=UPI000D6E39AB|nr:S8 family serine peptidase [Reichenbachiella versicolor]